MTNKALPVIHNSIIYNPSYIDYYLLLALKKFKEKFNTLHAISEHTKHSPLVPLELRYARLTIENALTQSFLVQHDETHHLLKERMAVIFMLAFWESIIWNSKSFVTAIYTLIPSAGFINITNTIINKHIDYQNALYGACITSVEQALATVKSPQRQEDKESYYQTLREKIQELQRLVEIRKEEIKNANNYIPSQSWFRILIDKFMYGLTYLIAFFQIFGIKCPSKKRVQKWKEEINVIVPLSNQPHHFIKTQPKKPFSSKIEDDAIKEIKQEYQALKIQLKEIKTAVTNLEKIIYKPPLKVQLED